MNEIDLDIDAIRALLAAVRDHDSGGDFCDCPDDHPAFGCMMSFQKEWVEAGRAVVRIEKRLKDGNS